MKRNASILLIGLCILAISTPTLFAEEAKYDFRKTNWGMSKEQVKATEDKNPDFEVNTMLSYSVMINEKDFMCTYRFLEDKLYNSECVFIGQHTNKNNYIDDYKELKEILIKKYGKPKIEEPELWGNELYKDDKSNWGTAISEGDLAYWDQWKTPNTKIDLMLWGENYKINLSIRCESEELKEWVKSEFLLVVEELDTPQKICGYMRNNFEYELHIYYAPIPQTLWMKKKAIVMTLALLGYI